jgi:hypothetical protein
MIKISFKFLLLICLFNAHLICSQNQGTQAGEPNDLDQAFVPDKNSVLNSVGSYASNTSSGPNAVLKNIIKVTPTLLGRSIAAVTWEHTFGKTMSLEGSIGASYGRDYIQAAFAGVENDAFSGNSGTQKYVPLSTILSNASNVGGATLFVSGGVKFYFTDIAPEGSYFQFNVRYYSNNLQYTPDNGSTPVVGNSTVSVRNLGLNIIYGYQIVSGRNSNFVQDLYFGFGLRRTAYDGFSIQTTSNTYGTQTVYVSDGSTQTSLGPTFLLGYALGFGF